MTSSTACLTRDPDQATPGAALRHYLANLAALHYVDPELAETLEALPFAACPVIEAARDGTPTGRVTADDGRPAQLHSRYRPRDEAEKLVAAFANVENPSFVLHGVGLGHHLAALESRFDRPVVLVAEDDLGLLKAALCCHDFAAPLREGRVTFITRAEKGLLHQQLKACNADLLLGLHFVNPPQANRYRMEFHRRIRSLMTEFISYARIQMVTLLKITRTTTGNIVRNLPSYVTNPGVECLADRGRGYPAIVVAAGPSLGQSLDLLRELQDRAVIISVQTAFKLLCRLGMPPHFVTSLDFHEVSGEFFRGLDSDACRRTRLVAEPKAASDVLDVFPGPRHVLYHRAVDDLLRDAAPRRSCLRAGSTVAHLSFYLAEHLGCDPIVFVGQDLSFTDGLYYPPGMPIEQVWRPELARFQTLEMKQWERIARNRPILQQVTTFAGESVYTDEQMRSYAEQFEAEFGRTSRRIIFTSERSMKLAGVTQMPLSAVAKEFCQRPLPPDLFDVPVPADVTSARVGAREQVAQRLEEVRELRDIAQRMLGLLEKLGPLVEKPAEFNRVVAQVDELRVVITRFERTYQLVKDVSQTAELRRYSADRRLGSVKQETADTARKRLSRDREFVAAFLEGCEFLERILPSAIERLEASE